MEVTDDLYKHLKCIFSHCFGILSHLRHPRFENTACKVVPSCTRWNINAPSTGNILGISSCSCLTPNWGDGSISFNISCVSFDRWLPWQRSHLGSAWIYQTQAATAVITADSNQYKKVVPRCWDWTLHLVVGMGCVIEYRRPAFIFHIIIRPLPEGGHF